MTTKWSNTTVFEKHWGIERVTAIQSLATAKVNLVNRRKPVINGQCF